MRPYFAWLVCTALAVYAFTQLLSTEPHLPPHLAGLLLLTVGLVAGLRWGADSAAQLIGDLARTNRVFAEQNDELSELNHELLEQLNAEMDGHTVELDPPNSTSS